jgi:N-dimethylarginine dimethylaminohydrolase
MRRLMCPPDYFDIEYVINPWMDLNNRVDRALARRQWDDFVANLRRFGDEVEFIAPDRRCPDMTFSGDGGLVVDRTFMPSNFRVPERQLEVQHYVDWFEARGYEIARYDSGIAFEGLGDVVFHGDRAIFGHGIRSDRRSLDLLRSLLPHLEVLCEMRIVDPRFFHLAMALSFLSDDCVLYYPPAFDEESRARLHAAVPDVLEASDIDTLEYFGCNNLVLGNRLLIDDATPDLEEALAKRGIETIRCPMSEFKKSGGSLRCLVLSFIDTGNGMPR